MRSRNREGIRGNEQTDDAETFELVAAFELVAGVIPGLLVAAVVAGAAVFEKVRVDQVRKGDSLASPCLPWLPLTPSVGCSRRPCCRCRARRGATEQSILDADTSRGGKSDSLDAEERKKDPGERNGDADDDYETAYYPSR
jgi:hypothetical protein